MRSIVPLLLLAAILSFSGCTKKRGPLEAAQLFFEQVGSGHPDDAYRSAAFGFQAQRSAVVFAAGARDMGLTDYAGGDWGTPDSTGNSCSIPVKVKTRGGTEIPLIVALVNETGAWRVFSVHSPPNAETGLVENRFTLVGKAPDLNSGLNEPAPPLNEIRQLVRDTLLHFNAAIAAKSFDSFYDYVSVAWQSGSLTKGEYQLTKGQLQRAFQPFIDRKVDLTEIGKLDPIFDTPPAINSDGLLIVSGHYVGETHKIVFALKYIYELPAWKLFGIDVNLVK
jgi:hypothetical protein